MTKSTHHSHALQVRKALWNLQKEILDALKNEFDREVGYSAAPAEWFRVLTTAERYLWLRELTSLMADIDIMTELEELTEAHSETARAEIERMMFDEKSLENFTKQYRALMMSHTHLLPFHAQLRADLQHLPKSTKDKEHHSAHRKQWHEEHRHQARKKRN